MKVILISLLSLFSTNVLAIDPMEQLRLLQGLTEDEKQAIIGEYATQTKVNVENPEQEVDTVKPLEMGNGDAQIQKELSEYSGKTLKPFGYNLFAGQPTTFAPVNSIPVPTDYVLGAGDQLKIQLFGSTSDQYDLVVNRNGEISLPEIGPVMVAGQSFSEAKILLTEKLKALGVGVKSSISMGELRSFRVFVLGESRTPGSYLVSGMATITHALYVSGGLSDIASYRNVQLKRQGKLIQVLDLYDLLLKGDTSKDARLQPGDTVFIPKVQKQVIVDGEVLKPALYEIKRKGYLKDVIELAGGLSADAYTKSIQVSRITSPEVRQNLSLDLGNKRDQLFQVDNGDKIFVPEVIANSSDLVRIRGKVALESEFTVDASTKLTDVLYSRRQFANDADLNAILIKRQAEIASDYQVIQIDWIKAIQDPLSSDNVVIMPRDEIIVLSQNNADERSKAVTELLDLLRKQETLDKLNPKVSIHGASKFSGSYPLVEGMTVHQLVALSGGLLPSAMLNEAELVRYEVVNGEKRQVINLQINIQKALQGDPKHNVELQAYDAITVKQITDWADASSVVTLTGEVAYPGDYVIKPGDTLENLLIRAGGFTEWAAPQNVIFTREALKEKERAEMDAMADELEKNLLFSLKENTSVDSPNSTNANAMVALGKTLVEKVKTTPAVGRLVIGLNPSEISKYQASLQLELRDGDELFIPKRSNEIVVMGEVSRPASLLFQKGITVEQYMEQSGGLTKRADDESIYIVRGDGSIKPYKQSMFSLMKDDLVLQPGDTIVVPMDVDRMSPMVTWTAVTKILSNLAVTAATLQTLGVIN